MGATYTRQSSTEIVDGEVINAADFNNEFAQLVSAFAVSTGHTHDGTTAEGGPVTKLLGTAITIGDGTAGTDIAVTFDGETSDGLLTWMEDEDHFKFGDDVVMDSAKRLYLYDEGGEYIYGDGTDLYLVSGADINIPADIGVTFGNDGEKIEGDGTDLTISGNNINLTATADVVIPADVGITFGTGEKIEGNNTDITVTSGAEINLTATTDVNIPTDVGITFGDDGEKIEGDGTNLTISSSAIATIDAAADIVIDAGGGDIFFKDDGTTFGSATNTSGDLIIKSGTTTAMTFSGANVTFSGTVTIGSAGISEAELEILDGAAVTTTELNIIDGDTAASSTTLVDADRVVVNDNGTMVQVALSDFETYFESGLDTLSSVTTVGALDAGSISSGFGNIDNGASNITSGGLVKLDVDADADDLTGDSATGRLTIGASEDLNLYHGGTNSYIVNDTGDLILDTADDILLDAAGGDIFFGSGGTTFGSATNTSGNLIIKSGTTTALTFSGANLTAAGTIGSGAITSTGVVTGTGFTIGSAAILEAELEILDGANVTTAELNLLDGSAKSTSSITVADSDAILIIDGTTTKQIPASDISTYVSGDATALAIALG